MEGQVVFSINNNGGVLEHLFRVFLFDEKWAVRTNIVVWEGRVSKGVNEEMTSTAMPPVRATKLLTRGATLKADTVTLLAS